MKVGHMNQSPWLGSKYRSTAPLLLRFLRMADRPSLTACWEWQGSLGDGYGRMSDGGAHRISFELFKGKIPPGMQIDHLCRNRKCVNPRHLEAVTPKENQSRWIYTDRATRCKYGHEFTAENTAWRGPNGLGRTCLICQARRSREYRQRKRAA